LAHDEYSGRERRERRLAKKMIAEYLEHALQFERLAAHVQNPKIKEDFEKQAKAYRKIAAERANKLGLQPPVKLTGPAESDVPTTEPSGWGVCS